MLPLIAVVSVLFAASATAEPSSRVALSPRLTEWKSDIQRTGKTTVAVIRVFTNRDKNEIELPEDAEFRPIVRRLLLSDSFVALFVQTHAMNVNLSTGIRPLSVVLLNMARSADWEGQEESVIAHEFGHIWLHVTGYPAPNAIRRLSCEAVHAGDIVQHVLIRDQMRLRHIDFLPFWVRTLEQALAGMNDQPAPATRCERAAMLALWVDVSLGLRTGDWPRRDEFLTALNRRSPELAAEALAIAQRLQGHDLQNHASYQESLAWVLDRIQAR